MLSIGGLLVLGERDLIARLVLTALILYSSTIRQIRPLMLVSLTLAGAVAITSAGEFRSYFLDGRGVQSGVYDRLNTRSSGKAMIAAALGGEFRTAGENLAQLVQHVPSDYPYRFGLGTLGDSMDAISVGVITDRAAHETRNLASWFSQTFYPALYRRGGGAGFTLVGQGWIDGGWIGVIVLMWLVGRASRWLLLLSSTSLIGFAFYLNLIPIAVYAIRQTTTVVLSQGMKHVLVAVLLAQLLAYLLSPARTGRPLMHNQSPSRG